MSRKKKASETARFAGRHRVSSPCAGTTRSEKLAAERVARVTIALRDLANTPLQTLELVRQKLMAADPGWRAQADRMGRALERLRRLNDVLAPYQAAMIWEGSRWSATSDRPRRERDAGMP
jgi:hypothetical protein